MSVRAERKDLPALRLLYFKFALIMFPADRDRCFVSNYLYLYFAILPRAETYLSGDRVLDRLYIGIPPYFIFAHR